MKILYNIGIQLFVVFVKLVSPFNAKARLWVAGRKGWYGNLLEKAGVGGKFIWVHCASLGEFEQGRPVIEQIREEMPGYRILLTFFSPSGYEIRKNYAGADIVCYLPADTPGNCRKFIKAVKPEMAIFVKYEFWDNYLAELERNGIPAYLISAIFRPGQHFFKWYGSFFRNILTRFTHIFVQDEKSAELLSNISVGNVSVAGDTRFDRVVQMTASVKAIPQIEMFRGGEKLFLAGSSWKPDEEIMAQYINRSPGAMKWIFAPHEIDRSNIERIEKLFTTEVVRFSEFTGSKAGARVLIIDNIGMLSSAYRYAHIAAIGGGFGRGIHNVLEPACWSVPVIFGPNHNKFREAVDLIENGGARSFRSVNEFTTIVDGWLSDEESRRRSAVAAGDYVKRNTGATKMIMAKIKGEDINTGSS